MRRIIVKALFCNIVVLIVLLSGGFLFIANPVMAADRVVLGELFNRDG